MTTTTTLGFPIPEDSDPLADVALWVRTLGQYVDDNVGKIAAGTVNVTMTATNGVGQAVSFPAGRFSAAPVVTATASNDNANVFAQVSAVTKDGFTVIARHRDSATTITATVAIHWTAVQQ